MARDVSPAQPGSLDPEALHDLVLLHEFFLGRDKAFQGLLGVRLPRSHLRDEILRLAVIEFGMGRVRRLSYYQRECARLASRFAVRDEVYRLGMLRALVLESEASGRALVVQPSQRLIDWYSLQMPRLAAEVARLFSIANVK